MEDDSERHWDLLEILETKVNFDAHDERKNLLRMFLYILSHMSLSLPEEAKQALHIAKAYLNETVSGKELEEHRVNMWTLIEGNDLNFQDANVCKIRAVICVMYPYEKEQDFHNLPSLFFEFCDGAGISSLLICNAITKFYSSYELY